jgi:hypothetical protein
VYQLFALLAGGAVIFFWLLIHIREFPYLVQGLIAGAVTLVTGAISYWVFRVDEVRDVLWRKVAGRFPAFARRG